MTRYIARIVIDGFQSHDHTELNLGPGVVALTGPSDNGKSAMLRAIRWALWNVAPGDGNWIRKGCTRAAVEITLSDGTVILRETNKGRNKYVLTLPGTQPEAMVDFGRGVPKAILEAHGMLPVRPDPDKKGFLLNFASQLDSPFFLSDGPTSRAKIVGRLAGINVLDTASGRAGDDIRTHNATLKRLEAGLSKLQEQLAQFEGLEADERRLERVEQILSLLPVVMERRRTLQTLAARMQVIREQNTRADMVLQRTATVGRVAELIGRVEQVRAVWVKLGNMSDGVLAVQEEMEFVEAVLRRTRYINAAEPLLLRADANQARSATLRSLLLRTRTITRGLEVAEVVMLRHVNLDQLSELAAEAQKRRDRLNKLYPVRQTRKRVVAGWTETAATLKRLAWVPQAVERLEQAVNVRYQLQRIKPLGVTLRRLQADIATIEQRLTQIEKRAPAAEMAARVTDDIQRRQALTILLARAGALQQQMTRTDQIIASVEGRLCERTSAYAEALREAGVCPFCLQDLTEDARARIISEFTNEEVHSHV